MAPQQRKIHKVRVIPVLDNDGKTWSEEAAAELWTNRDNIISLLASKWMGKKMYEPMILWFQLVWMTARKYAKDFSKT